MEDIEEQIEDLTHRARLQPWNEVYFKYFFDQTTEQVLEQIRGGAGMNTFLENASRQMQSEIAGEEIW